MRGPPRVEVGAGLVRPSYEEPVMANCTCKFNAELDRNHRPWCDYWSRAVKEALSDQIDKKMDIAQKWATALVDVAGLKVQVECLEKERDMLGREADRLRRDYAHQMDILAEVQGVLATAMDVGTDVQAMYLAIKAALNGRPLCQCNHSDDEHGVYGCVEDCSCELRPDKT